VRGLSDELPGGCPTRNTLIHAYACSDLFFAINAYACSDLFFARSESSNLFSATYESSGLFFATNESYDLFFATNETRRQQSEQLCIQLSMFSANQGCVRVCVPWEGSLVLICLLCKVES